MNFVVYNEYEACAHHGSGLAQYIDSLDTSTLEAISSFVGSTFFKDELNRQFELIFADKERMRALNLEYMGNDYSTDVLTFPLWSDADGSFPVSGSNHGSGIGFPETSPANSVFFDNEKFIYASIGSVVINLDLAAFVSNELGHSLEDEIALLFIHGVLHLVGFDHENDNGEHRYQEEFLVNMFGLPSSLVSRDLGNKLDIF